MRVVIVLSLALLPFAFSSLAMADPPANAESQIETTPDDGIGKTLRMILERLDEIETRLSRMEQKLRSMRNSPVFSEGVERGMQIDAIERERRLVAPLEKEMRPLDRR